MTFWKFLVGRCEWLVVLARRRRVTCDDRPSQHRHSGQHIHLLLATLHRNYVQYTCQALDQPLYIHDSLLLLTSLSDPSIVLRSRTRLLPLLRTACNGSFPVDVSESRTSIFCSSPYSQPVLRMSWGPSAPLAKTLRLLLHTRQEL